MTVASGIHTRVSELRDVRKYCFLCVTKKFATYWSFVFSCLPSCLPQPEDAVSTPGIYSKEQSGALSSCRRLSRRKLTLHSLEMCAVEEGWFVGLGSRLAHLGRTGRKMA